MRTAVAICQQPLRGCPPQDGPLQTPSGFILRPSCWWLVRWARPKACCRVYPPLTHPHNRNALLPHCVNSSQW